VAFEISGKLGPVAYCHCDQCRRASGSAFAANADVRVKYLRWSRGRELIREFESSPGKFRAFCSACGSPMYSRRAARADIVRIRLGTLDGDPERRVAAHGHVASKAPWFEITDALPRFPGDIPPLDAKPGRLLGIATRTASSAPMSVLETAEVTTQAGVAGDVRGKPGSRQVTIVAREAWEDACRELGTELPWTTRRANLLVEGLSLVKTAGRRLRIGSVRLEVCAETDPCRVMDAQRPGLRAALTPDWRGGVSCRVLESGYVASGDAAWWEPA
jgi:MOSC domain-containing protein YiiM